MSKMRCSRCRRRYRRQDDWNDAYIAGLLIGHLCPNCQTAEEAVEGQVNVAAGPPVQVDLNIHRDGPDALTKLMDGLCQAYPTPEIMRAKADVLTAARQDPLALELGKLMRMMAVGMETGAPITIAVDVPPT